MFASLVSIAVLAAAPKVVMPEWTRVEVSPELGTFYADQLAQALRKHGMDVVTATELSTLLGLERQKQLLGCTDADTQSCLAELGNALGADGMVVVSLAKLDDAFRANLKVLSTRTGAVLTETSVDASGQKQLLDELTGAAEQLAKAFDAKPAPRAPGSGPNLRRFALAPAIVAAVSVLTGGILGGVAQFEYDLLKRVPTYNDALSVQRNGEAAQAAMWAAFGLAAVAAAASVLLYLLGAPQ